MNNALDRIIEAKKKRLAGQKGKASLEEMKNKSVQAGEPKDFKAVLAAKKRINIIAEIKRASPSAGDIAEAADPAAVAEAYEKAGARAVSVLTEEDFFKGSIDFIASVKKKCSLPVLRKDFIFDEYQIYESRAAGADAVLLIAALLGKNEFNDLCVLAKKLGLSVLCEVHNEKDLDTVLSARAEIIGINNRDLKNLKVDTTVSERMIKQVPEGIIVVVESGIKTEADVRNFYGLGVNSFLIGETLMRSKNVKETMNSLLGVAKNG
ncbi:MAG: indole-3-glycerol phosphate synthase TrpC [Endomicrobiales bacterium]|nr:indole-3-glycerol phosphate synthase TrpC [Endomicrobiales bacterium]